VRKPVFLGDIAILLGRQLVFLVRKCNISGGKVQFLGENVMLGEKTAISERKWPTCGRKLVFLVGNAEFLVRKLAFLVQNVLFLGESWYFWEKMSCFWLKNGICGWKLQFLAENGMFLGENWYLWWKMSYFCDKTVTCWRKYHIFGEKTAISES
ncbi:hypothetical protein, partial [Helicobacter pylori]|uniref:hypothetical protein n=1 Tax=Helicobacter pylori TaxID=210 RepID=UPI0027121EB9